MFTQSWDYFHSVKHRIPRKGRCLQEDGDVKDPTPIINLAFLGCTQRNAQADTKILKSEAELFTRLTTMGDACDKDQTTASLDCSKTLLLVETGMIPTQHPVECCTFLVHALSYLSLGSARRNRRISQQFRV